MWCSRSEFKRTSPGSQPLPMTDDARAESSQLLDGLRLYAECDQGSSTVVSEYGLSVTENDDPCTYLQLSSIDASPMP